MSGEEMHWTCSVCSNVIPKDKIFIELRTDALICEDCLEQKRQAQKEVSSDPQDGHVG
jgi:hypothetical protein